MDSLTWLLWPFLFSYLELDNRKRRGGGAVVSRGRKKETDKEGKKGRVKERLAGRQA